MLYLNFGNEKLPFLIKLEQIFEIEELIFDHEDINVTEAVNIAHIGIDAGFEFFNPKDIVDRDYTELLDKYPENVAIAVKVYKVMRNRFLNITKEPIDLDKHYEEMNKRHNAVKSYAAEGKEILDIRDDINDLIKNSR